MRTQVPADCLAGEFDNVIAREVEAALGLKVDLQSSFVHSQNLSQAITIEIGDDQIFRVFCELKVLLIET